MRSTATRHLTPTSIRKPREGAHNAMDSTVKARPIPDNAAETVSPSLEQVQQIKLMKFLTVFGFGGTERQVVTLVRMLDRSRFDPRFACLRRWGHFLNEIESVCQIPVSEYP